MNTFTEAALPVIIGFTLHKLIAAARRKKDSRNTPFHFDLKFWWHDNWISIVFHTVLILAVVLYLEDSINAVTGYKHTPKQIAELLGSVSLKLWFFVGGFITALPITFFEKKLRDGKKKIGIMAK